MNCPCCKVTNTLNEYKRHPSITSFKSLEAACIKFHDTPMDENVQLIRACAHHCDGKRLGNWFDVLLEDATEALNRGFVVHHIRSRSY